MCSAGVLCPFYSWGDEGTEQGRNWGLFQVEQGRSSPALALEGADHCSFALSCTVAVPSTSSAPDVVATATGSVGKVWWC